jgi:PAT family beta-lactamase induction signal transducer AmpG
VSEAAPTKKPSFWDAFSSPRLALMIALGFSSGLPNQLAKTTLPGWLATEGVSLAMIGLASWLLIPYNLKFLWAPLLDRYTLPLGRRRGWMVLTQLVLAIGIATLGLFEPRTMLWAIGAVALTVVFFSASQDIVVDAYRTDVLPAAQRASGTAIFVSAYRVASIVATAGALMLSEVLPWNLVFFMLGGLMSVGVIATLIAPEPVIEGGPPRTLATAVGLPFEEFFKRKGWRVALLFLGIISLYKFGDTLSTVLQTPFLIRYVHFTPGEVGGYAKALSFAAIPGAFIGSGIVARYGLKRPMIAFGIAQATANLGYAVLAIVGKSYGVMIAVLGIDFFFGGMGTTALVALLMTLCNKRLTAVQFALFSSLSSLLGHVVGGVSGWLTETIGWAPFFALTLVAAVPGLVLLSFAKIDEPSDA